MPTSSSHASFRLLRMTGAVVAIVVMLLAAGWWLSRPASPGAFYAAPPSGTPARGRLLRSEPFTHRVPPGARARRILYATTRADDKPAIASALVVASDRAASAPRPVVAWAHGTTGIATGCAPSLMQNPFANVPALDEIIREDWVFVATDYVGLGTAGVHAYLVGEEAARAVLDAITAAREMDGLLMDTSAVVWGHSQGGNTALWTAMRAATYAPGLQVAGVAALAPATDLPALVTSAKGSLFGKIVSTYLLDAYATTYPDVSNKDYAARGTDWLRADIASRCVGEWATLFSVLEAWLLPSGGIFARDPTTGPLGSRLRENTPLGPFAAPLLIAQGDLDDLVLPAVQRGWVDGRCAAGQSLDFRVMPGLDHISLVAPASPIGAQLITWSKERFARRPPADTCKR